MKVIAKGGRVRFMCPGCKGYHVVDSSWSFNGDVDRPTLSPSVLVRGYLETEDHPHGGPVLCHSFVRAGWIEFLGDSAHVLAGTTVELPEIPA